MIKRDTFLIEKKKIFCIQDSSYTTLCFSIAYTAILISDLYGRLNTNRLKTFR